MDLTDARVLLVDDTEANLDMLCELLEPEGYRVSMAPNGEIALKIAERLVPELILLDVMMPGIDGFEVCRRLKSEEKTASIPVIFVTAQGLTESLVNGFEVGGVDYISKPFQNEEVLMRVRTHLSVYRLTREREARNVALAEKNRQLEEAKQCLDQAHRQRIADLERELQVAHDLQMGLMPAEAPCIDGLEVAARCVPAAEVGGDFFQYFHQGDRLSISMADVTGHAMQAAIPVVMFDGILDSQMLLGDELEDLFARLNDSLSRKMNGYTHVCFSMAQIELSTRSLRFANAGCPYPYFFQAAAGQVTELQVDAYPLGVCAGTDYRAVESGLADGDCLVFCSDGVAEALNPAAELFGYERTAQVIEDGCRQGLGADALLERLLGEVRRFSGNRPQEDDQTVVVLCNRRSNS